MVASIAPLAFAGVDLSILMHGIQPYLGTQVRTVLVRTGTRVVGNPGPWQRCERSQPVLAQAS
jgi:hypothetical protein